MLPLSSEQLTRQLRRVALRGARAEIGDGQLLEAFLARRDEAAFETLVRRHGPLVLGVCQRVIGNVHDAEDAFQATFLVFARKAATIRPPTAVVNWLYGVAYRTARRARAVVARRRSREKQVQTMPQPTVEPADYASGELERILDQELNRLPDRYRLPLLLCELEGWSRKEAARYLQLPEGTLSSRLATARKRLAQRLTRRGLTLSGGVLAALTGATAPANVPPPPVSTTVQVVCRLAETGGVSAPVAALAKGVMQAMLLSKLKGLILVLLIVTMLLVSAEGLRPGARAEKPPSPAGQSGLPDAAESRPRNVAGAGGQKASDDKRLQGSWVLAAVEFEGKKIPPDQVRAAELSWVVKGDRINVSARGRTCELSYRLETAPQPRRVTLTPVAGQGDPFFPGGMVAGETFAGIYRLVDDEWMICVNTRAGNAHPKDFQTRKDSPCVLYVLRRGTAAGEQNQKPPVDLLGELEVGRSKMRQLGLALFMYEQERGALPPAALVSKEGKPLLSWRVALLPYLDEPGAALYQQFKLDEPWDSASNRKLLSRMPAIYASPGKLAEPGHTFYQVFVGQGTAFTGGEGRKAKEIKDLPNTVLLVEAGAAVPWTKPQDLTYDPAQSLPKLGGPFRTGFHVLLGFSNVPFNRNDFDRDLLRRAIERGGERP